MIKVNSSDINAVDYDYQRKTLTILFHSGGKYEYYNVPLNVYNSLLSAESKGRYFDKFIKHYYQYRKINI